MNTTAVRTGFLVLVIGGGFLTGLFSVPGAWYAGLDKPPFNPPGWVFGPVWTVLYILIAMAGWRTWEMDRASLSMRLWWAQLVLNFIWPLVFFGLQQPWIALVIILALLATILAFVVRRWSADRVSAVVFLPYAAWVSFATLLNLSLAILN